MYDQHSKVSYDWRIEVHILPDLPYEKDALEPYISKETLDYHYSKHHKKYIDELNRLLKNSPFENDSLENIVKNADGSIFNNAAQAWNHNLYWRCMTENPEKPSDSMIKAINQSFESFELFADEFKKAALMHFGSGWVWLAMDDEKRLKIMSTANADTPMRYGHHVLLACDVWEHAYYIDTRNDRAKYLDNFLQIVNWSVVWDNHRLAISD